MVKHNQKLQRKLRESIVACAVEDLEMARRKSKKKASKAAQDLEMAGSAEDNDAMRDQGICRPRVLILCPFRGTYD